ncbi:GNAT family N-acetyltransferase [Nocardioides pantholopis]|uniref:GNAT family N-acetyltransferase n=1 Tax=Nocardioides pantholopis TaxID=2483798 RepID=UPI000FDA7C8B|nr:GNAT family N-acetyltransferase [Nocardioides pantholopis]
MPDEPEPQHANTGRHGLGPHVVGQRIVVRRLLPGETGPTGGPAMTDLLGTCTSWDATACTVQPEDGAPVTIPLAEIVSGKPVPPRPSVRHRTSARDAEQHVLALFPGIEIAPLGEWLLRSDPAPRGRLRKRANSCLALGDPGAPYDEAIEAVLRFYAERDRPALAQVEADSEIEEALLDRGWQHLPHGEAELRLAALSRVRRSRRARRDRTSGAPGREARLEVSGDLAQAVVRDPDLDDAVVAAGRATLDGDWLGLHELNVASDHRRRGLAGVVLDELLEWGAERGATTVWLHVETDNAPALALYGGLGLERHHTCRYLTAPD